MINELKVNNKVAGIQLKLHRDNEINENLIKRIINNDYSNMYSICIFDFMDSVNDSIHDLIK